MKKLIASSIFALAICAASFAQKVQIGFHHGIGKAQLSNHRERKNDGFGADRVASSNSGIGIQWNFRPRLAMEVSCFFTKKGTVRYFHSEKYSYLQSSASLRFNFRKNHEKAWQPYFRVGEYFAMLTKHQELQPPPGKAGAEIYLMEYSTPLPIDLGLMGGLGMEWRVLPKIFVSLEARTEHGLRDVFDVSPERKSVFNVAGWGIAGVKYAF